MLNQIEARLKEAEKLGFKKVIVPERIYNIKQFRKEKYKLEIVTVKHVRGLAGIINKN